MTKAENRFLNGGFAQDSGSALSNPSNSKDDHCGLLISGIFCVDSIPTVRQMSWRGSIVPFYEERRK